MGGKRPDQYRIDPRETQASDHKFRPLDRKGAEPDAKLYGRVMKGSVKKSQPVPPEVLEPEVERDRAEEMRRQDKVHDTQEERHGHPEE
jgi:hypothetical protein